MSGWTDAHCHLQDHFLDRTNDDVPDKIVTTLQRASAAGVERVIVVGTDVDTSKEALAIAEGPSPVELFATVGLHPHDADEDLAPVAALARQGSPRLVGIGECGLDYFYEHSPRSRQREAFAAQVGLAHELDLALVVHARDAFDDLIEILRSEGVPARTVIHCFTGTPRDAESCLALGRDVSISGIVTFKNADALREAACLVPLARLHVETDSPFLAPVPFAARRMSQRWSPLLARSVAELRGEDLGELRDATCAQLRTALPVGGPFGLNRQSFKGFVAVLPPAAPSPSVVAGIAQIPDVLAEDGYLSTTQRRALSAPAFTASDWRSVGHLWVVLAPGPVGAATHAAVHMPDLVGRSRAQVFRTMHDDGLYFVTRGPGSADENWIAVAAQSPRPGMRIAWHGEATLSVTTRAPRGPRRVPRLVGAKSPPPSSPPCGGLNSSLRPSDQGVRTESGSWRSPSRRPPGTSVAWHDEITVRVEHPTASTAEEDETRSRRRRLS